MKRSTLFFCALALILASCNLPGAAPAPTFTPQPTFTSTPNPTETPIPPPTSTPIPPPTATETPAPSPTATETPVPVVESLEAIVTAEKLSCRYGPGAEYLYLDGLRKGWKLKLIGRTDGNNWVLVQGSKNRCWVNAKFLEIKGDRLQLKVMYPAEYRLPVSPYYSAPIVLSAVRDGNNVTVKWSEIALRPGDEEDENMFVYIIEVWRCEGGQIVFDPLASNYPEVAFVDEPGCAVPSHGRVFFQEKHGYAGPAEIPWPPR